MKTDVLLLADIFENFRKLSFINYSLDPAHYLSSPQLSWDAMLLYTQCHLTLINDPEMFNLIDSGIRGGVSMIVHRFAQANNPEMGIRYDKIKELSYIVYLDANNLYGWAMSQSLPIDDFSWLTEEEWSIIDWQSIPDHADYGFLLECDLEYPEEIHDLHSDYPFAPEKCLFAMKN